MTKNSISSYLEAVIYQTMSISILSQMGSCSLEALQGVTFCPSTFDKALACMHINQLTSSAYANFEFRWHAGNKQGCLCTSRKENAMTSLSSPHHTHANTPTLVWKRTLRSGKPLPCKEPSFSCLCSLGFLGGVWTSRAAKITQCNI